ncbi:MAG: redoxin domain-containing protein [Acidobacteriota bacterium]|nr:redoxin domain-containing protein [Acidobacteriota bacterium]
MADHTPISKEKGAASGHSAIGSVSNALDSLRTQHGANLTELSSASPVLTVFLRHAGCSFCRETLADLGSARAAIERGGVRVVLVHMDDHTALRSRLEKYGLGSADRIHDPGKHLYRAFGLKGGSFRQLFGFRVLWRALAEGVLMKFRLGISGSDTSQMPGVFLIHNSALVRRFRHRNAGERPDYIRFCLGPDGQDRLKSSAAR